MRRRRKGEEPGKVEGGVVGLDPRDVVQSSLGRGVAWVTRAANSGLVTFELLTPEIQIFH